MVIALVQASAKTFSQQITLKATNVPLTQVLKSIEQQSGYVFFYDSKLADQNVTVSVTDASIQTALTETFKNVPITYKIADKNIILQAETPNLIDKLKSTLNISVTVSAKVVDELGKPMSSVTVREKGTTNATVTDDKGIFSISVPDNNSIVVFSFIGYDSQELRGKDIAIGSAVVLKAASTNLKEVVVNKGYYDEKSELSTGDVGIVSSKVIGEQPVVDPIAALEGRVAGLSIQQIGSGLPGGAYKVLIRGQSSLTNGSNPLYIVDGVPFTSIPLNAVYTSSIAQGLSPFNSLDISSIESIEVLKDADATSIYGSRGANGVIIITTKKGQAGKTKVDVNLNQGISQATHLMPLMNTQQYLTMRHQAFANDGATPGARDYDINGTWDTTRYTNWEKVLFDHPASFTNAQLNISGGNTNTQFLIGGGYTYQGATVPGNFADQKGTGHINVTNTSDNQRLKISFTVDYTNDQDNLPQQNLSSTIFLAPDAPAIYNPNGSLNWANGTFNNPYAYLLPTANSTTENINGSFNLIYKILKGLNFNIISGYNYIQQEQYNNTPLTAFSPQYATQTDLRTTSYGNSNIKTYSIEPTISYDASLGKSKFSFLIGTSIEQSVSNTFSATGSNYSSDALLGNLSAAGTISGVANSNDLFRRQSILGRVNYNLNDEYVINLTGNRDGSSRFGPGRQFGNFGAIGTGWIFTKEKSIQDALPFLSFGKLRVSYGITGSDQIGDYRYLSTYYPFYFSYQNITGLIPGNLNNPDYGWEIDKQLDGGIEMSFLKDIINLNVSYYQKRSNNQLIVYPLSTITGFSSVEANLPANVQNSGLELTLNTINFKSKSFSWKTSFNLTINRNKLLSFPNLSASPYANQYVIGQPTSIAKYLTYTGISSTTGTYTFLDVNKDGLITYPEDYTNVINLNPKYFGGLQNSFTYKGLQLDIFFQFVNQLGHSYLTNSFLPGSFNSNSPNSNEPSYLINNPNIEKYSQSFSSLAYTSYEYYKNSNADFTNASFVRLKNVQLSYQIPLNWQQKLHIQNARIFVQFQNLLTITKYQGVDPENQGYIPPMKTSTIGVQVTF